MKLVVGLGNPGTQYRNTRHNVGFRIADRVAELLGVSFEEEKYEGLIARAQRGRTTVLVLKPLTYMNNSGVSVAKATRNRVTFLGDMLVIADEVQLPLGRMRLRERGSAGGHNGLKSIIAQVGTQDFPRLRIGVGENGPGVGLSEHVLGGFKPEEKPEVDRVVEAAASGVLTFLDSGIVRAMNEINKRSEPDDGPTPTKAT